jgi:uncharacterized protein (TIGR02145 family)
VEAFTQQNESEYVEATVNFWMDCNGVWGGTAVVDCSGECDGTAIEDCNGDCNGTAVVDCNGDCDGTAFENPCDICVGGNTGYDTTYCNPVTDIDGNQYETLIIGDQAWMMENLKVMHYRSGDEIPRGGFRQFMTIRLYDSYGDGWDSGLLTVNGNHYYVPSGNSGSCWGPIEIFNGTYDWSYMAGSFPGENSWEIIIQDNTYEGSCWDFSWGSDQIVLSGSGGTGDQNGTFDINGTTTSHHYWDELTTDEYAVYLDDFSYAEIYGLFYNWYAVDDSRGLCPDGWSVPTDEDWIELEMYLGMSEIDANIFSEWRGSNEGSKLAGNPDLWVDGILEGDSDFGISSFNALPGSARRCNYQCANSFFALGERAYFYSSTDGIFRYLNHENTGIYRSADQDGFGGSVRCIKD